MDYYNSVKQPIDLIKIQQKLKTDEYETFEQFDEDIVLLFSNAINYYEVSFYYCSKSQMNFFLNKTVIFLGRHY